jgi:hypothetical protein
VRRSTTTIIAVVLSLVAALATLPANAHTLVRNDGDDTKGILDLASIEATHDPGSIRYTFTTYRRWRTVDLGNDSYFLVAFDRDQDGDAERCAFVFKSGASLAGSLTNCRRDFIDELPVEKPSGRKVSVSIGETSLGGTHDWRAFSFYAPDERPCLNGCADAVPNRGVLLHDLEPPLATWNTTTTGRFHSTQVSKTTTIPVSFDVTDADTGVAGWEIGTLQGETWTPLASGTSSGNDLVSNLVLEEGKEYLLRIRATDLHENESTTTSTAGLRLAVPYDDQNALLEPAAGWTQISDPEYFQGTALSSSTVGSTITFTFTAPIFGTRIEVLGGPGDGYAEMTVSSEGNVSVLSESAATAKSAYVGGRVVSDGTHTVTIEVADAPFVLDGIVIRV